MELTVLLTVSQAHDDSATLTSVFKMMEGFEGLLERTTVAADIRRRAAGLLSTLSLELQRVRASCALQQHLYTERSILRC